MPYFVFLVIEHENLEKMQAPPAFDAADVAQHNTEQDCWVVINGDIWDVTGGCRPSPIIHNREKADQEQNGLPNIRAVNRPSSNSLVKMPRLLTTDNTPKN